MKKKTKYTQNITILNKFFFECFISCPSRAHLLSSEYIVGVRQQAASARYGNKDKRWTRGIPGICTPELFQECTFMRAILNIRHVVYEHPSSLPCN